MIKVYIERVSSDLIVLTFPSIGECYDCKRKSDVIPAIEDHIGDEPYELIQGSPE